MRELISFLLKFGSPDECLNEAAKWWRSEGRVYCGRTIPPGTWLLLRENQRRFSLIEIADVLARLMCEVLGYKRFGSQGGDWGSRLGYAYPKNVVGIHISLLAIPRERPTIAQPNPAEEAFLEQLANWLREETGYSQMMATKPQTLSYALTDSPVGLAAWVLEKFRTWSDCAGNPDSWLGREYLATNLMLYWAPGAIGSSFWPYYARYHSSWIVPRGEKVIVPCGYAEFAGEFLRPPRSLAEHMYGNITRWTKMKRGGHFPAVEQPAELCQEIREYFRTLRQYASGGEGS